MKIKVLSLIISAVVVFAAYPVSAAETDLQEERKILNSAVLKPDEFLKSGSADYDSEAKAGARSSQRLGEPFTVDDAHNLIKKTLDELLDGSSTDTYTKVKIIYDWLVYNVKYEFGGYGNFASVYSVLKKKIGVCDDFSYVFSAMCRYIGLNARCVDGYTYSVSGYEYDHVWVEIKIDGIQYVFDPQVQNNILESKGYNNYSRFCKTFDSISKYYKRITDIDSLYITEETGDFSGAFSDVTENEWYYEAVNFVSSRGIMNGIGNGLFNPGGTISRAAFVTALYRTAGSPAISETTQTFSDVPEKMWYTDAVNWASLTNISHGIGDGKFGTDDSLTFEQAVTFLYRFSQITTPESPAPNDASLSAYSDAKNLSDWSKTPFIWGESLSLFKNIPSMKTTLNFTRKITRGECAEIIKALSEAEK